MNDIDQNYEELLAGVERGESLPISWYTDPAMTNLELERIFRRTWQYIGPTKELRNVGDYITGFAGNVPVVAVRNEDGLAGFVNVCRHRRHLVMKERGCAQAMRCGYHAWTYDLTGRLKGVPRSGSEPDLDLADYPLLPARAEALGPWVFVNLDLNAAPVASYYGGVLDLIAQSGLDLNGLELWQRNDWQGRANWKTMLENFLECYHCAVAHPGFSAAIDVRPESYRLTTYSWFLSQIGRVRDSALAGDGAMSIVQNGLLESQYHLLWPNMTISINPGFPNLGIDVWNPNGPNGTKGFSETWFGRGVNPEFAEEMSAFNTQVGKEDDDLTDAVQTGLLSGLPEKGRFLTRAEHLAVDFQRLAVNAMCGREKPPTSSDRNAYVELEVTRVEPESEEISSFYLRRVDGAPIEPWRAGMFLPIRLTLPGQDVPIFRTFTISNLPNQNHEIRLSIKRRSKDSVASKTLHAQGVGTRIESMTPRGTFVLDSSSDRPVVLISGGVGITPMIAFTDALIEKGRASGQFRPITFIHGARNGRAHAFGKHLKAAASEHPSLAVHVRYSCPEDGDTLGVTHDSTGHIDAELIGGLVQPAACDFYLCGPSALMQGLYDALTGLGADPAHIHFESFGSATVRRGAAASKPDASTSASAIPVRFEKSGVETQWASGQGSILDLAEQTGLAPVFGCRSGICGTCTTRLVTGSVAYLEEPIAPIDPGRILICCSVPQPAFNPDGEAVELVLNL